MKPITSFRTACAAAADYICLSGAMDLLAPRTRYTRVITYDEQDQYIWSFHEEHHTIIAIRRWEKPGDEASCFVTLSNEGDLTYMDAEDHTEKIPGAGVFSEGTAGWGYMSHLRQIDEHLYACGDGGQVYRRHGPDDWRHIDAGLLQTPPITDRLQLNCIHGLTEDDIYLAGDFPGPTGLEGRLFHFDGSAWRPLTIPPVGYLNAIHIESAERIWVCGENGALLLGNARDGFRNLSRIEDNQLFYSLTLFGGLLYLASNLGLFSYDPAHPDAGIREVVTGLTPELQDAHIVDACDGVLWSIGFKDIVRFDGTRWERIHHPDNPRIGLHK